MPAHVRDLFNPDQWGLPAPAVERLGDDLRAFWKRFRGRFRTRMRDTSEQAYWYWRGQLTMEDARNYTNIERRLGQGDGQNLQQFMSDSPWSKQAVCDQIQDEIGAQPALQHGGLLILDESSDETAGEESAGAGRQHNGRLGKIELSVTAVALTYAHPASGTWVLVDGELFLQEQWFTEAYAERRQKVGLPPARTFATKPELGWQLIRRAQARGLPFELVACDDLYGRSREFRASLEAAQIQYVAEVPSTTQVYLQCPKVGVPRRRHARGKSPSRLQVLSRLAAHEVQALARSRATEWQRVAVRPTERGQLVADFSVRSVWTVTAHMQVRREWLVIRRDDDGRLTYMLLNAPETTSAATLIERSCWRYFTERAYHATRAKSELGWADLQARKYRAWEHHLALTAAATWFVAGVKLEWRDAYPRDPELARQFDLEVLPALSTANVRELLQAILPLPQLTPERARHVVATHLVNRARSTASRLKIQHFHEDSG